MSTKAHAAPRISGPANPLAPYLALAALWLLTITLVPPRGNFPLNDDWIYAKIVQHLVDTGHYEASPYADPTFILQAYWGAAFVKVLGFSFDTLRISTLVLGLVAVWASHWAAREAGLNPRWSFLVALTLLVNPLFLNLSYTFMTDVPFLALSLLSAAAYLRAFRTQHVRWLALATALCVAAYFIRQFAAVLLVAAIPAILLFKTTRSESSESLESPPRHRSMGGPPMQALHRSQRFLRAALPVLLAVLAPLLIGALLYLALPIGGLHMTQSWDWSLLGDAWTQRILEITHHFVMAFIYLALFATPILMATPRAKWRRKSTETLVNPPQLHRLPTPTPCHSERSEESPPGPARLTPACAFLATLPALIAWLLVPVWPHRLPKLGNLLYDLGVGPVLMPGMLDGLDIAAPLRLGPVPWWLITAPAIVGAAALLVFHTRPLSPRTFFSVPASRADAFLTLVSLGMLLVLTLPPVLARFDRYFVIAQVPATILTARALAARRPKPVRLAYAIALAFYAFGVVSLQDYLAWNTARWQALATLQRDHAAPLDQINGGYEFNGWHHSDHFAAESKRTGKKVFGPLGWWTLADDYRVSLRPDKHFQVIARQPYFSWLGFQQREMLLQKRTTPDETFLPR